MPPPREQPADGTPPVYARTVGPDGRRVLISPGSTIINGGAFASETAWRDTGPLPPQDQIADDARWDPPAPVKVPQLRRRLLEYITSDLSVQCQAAVLAEGRGTLIPDAPTPAGSAKLLCEQEAARLRKADLYYATADMTRVARAAGASLRNYSLAPDDLPSQHGFMVFEEPIGFYIESGVPGLPPERILIVAVTWGPFTPGTFPDGGVWISFYSPKQAYPARVYEAATGVRPTEQDLARLAQAWPPLRWDNESAWGFQEQAGDQPAPPQSTGSWELVLRAAWLLMQQPLTVQESVDAPVKVQRRLRRAGYEVAPVRVVRIRQATRAQGAPAGGGQAAVNWTCRWLVKGFWRWQWLPSRGVHRKTWIPQFQKGPPDKPLRLKETVNLWDR